jgi:three-Cys-motif partner protein
MPLGFHKDAIILSGETGTKLKSSIISGYYERWWDITSGGHSRKHRFPTSIIEMNAATGEVYIENTQETLLGSAGHALKLKDEKGWNARNLKIVCIEEDASCFEHLKQVIKRRWGKISIKNSEGPIEGNTTNVYLLQAGIDEAIEKINQIPSLGNSIYFFDPLLYIEWGIIDKVARNRITSYYKTGTEFIIFLFTSDWFTGRDDFSALPTSLNELSWSGSERETVESADELFGNQYWRKSLLNKLSISERETQMVNLYCVHLFNWFRYVLPLPFKPKMGQLYHLFFCSNYEAGINITKRYYQDRTGNPKYSPSNRRAYSRFRLLHPEVFFGIKHPRRPLEWKLLWKIIKEHQYGMCDLKCRDFVKEEPDPYERAEALDWLKNQGYIEEISIVNPIWEEHYPRYILDWKFVADNLKIELPEILKPIEP